MLFIKPEINIPMTPFVNIWIKNEYDRVQTRGQLVDFVHAKLEEIEITENKVHKQALKSIVYPLYSIITNRSYESKITI